MQSNSLVARVRAILIVFAGMCFVAGFSLPVAVLWFAQQNLMWVPFLLLLGIAIFAAVLNARRILRAVTEANAPTPDQGGGNRS